MRGRDTAVRRLPIAGERPVDAAVRRLVHDWDFGDFLVERMSQGTDELVDFLDSFEDPSSCSIRETWEYLHVPNDDSEYDDDPECLPDSEPRFGDWADSEMDEMRDTFGAYRETYLLRELRKMGFKKIDPDTLQHECHVELTPIPWPKTPGVYIIEVEPGIVKIGVAKNIKDRCSSAQTYCAREVRLLAHLPGDRATEQSLHRRFTRERVRSQNELFRTSGRLMAFIREARINPALALSEATR